MKKLLAALIGLVIILMTFLSFVSCKNNSGDDNTEGNYNQESHQHINSESVRENEVLATCTTSGSYDLVVYCADESCGVEISRETKTSNPTHNYVDDVCLACGEKKPTLNWLYFKLSNDGSYYIVSYKKGNNKKIKEIVIPSVFESKPVKAIAEGGFKNCNVFTEITIPDSITEIGKEAFYQCSLSSITIPDGVTTIGDSTFCYSNFLSSITIPDSVTSIGYRAFDGCSHLKSIDLPDGITKIESFTFGSCYRLESVTIPSSVKSIGYGAFNNCTSLTSITLPYGIECIDYFAFQNCTSLESVTISSSITSIENNAFSGCEKLQFSIYDNAKYLGNKENPYVVCMEPSSNSITSNILHEDTVLLSNCAFADCHDLETLVIPANLTVVGADPFKYCVSLKSFDVHEDNLYYKDIDGNLYSKDGKILIKYATKKEETSFTVPDGVVRIEDFAFRFDESLLSVSLPDSLQEIGNNSFDACRLLSDLTLPNGIKSIEERAFDTCRALDSIVMPNSLEHLGDWAFCECQSLEEVVLSESLSAIGNYVFSGCSALKSIVIPDSVTEVIPSAFEGCTSLFSVTIGSGVTYIGTELFGDSKWLAEIINRSSVDITDNHLMSDYAIEIHSGESKIVNKNNFIFYTYNGVNYLSGYLGDATKLVLPADYNGESYEIKNYAFYERRTLVSVTIPDSVTKIGDCAFAMCVSLKKVSLSDSVTSIGDWAFSHCQAIESIIIPDSVVSIGDFAFQTCLAMTDVYYAGTEEEWKAIVIGDNNTYLTDATKHFKYISEV